MYKKAGNGDQNLFVFIDEVNLTREFARVGEFGIRVSSQIDPRISIFSGVFPIGERHVYVGAHTFHASETFPPKNSGPRESHLSL